MSGVPLHGAPRSFGNRVGQIRWSSSSPRGGLGQEAARLEPLRSVTERLHLRVHAHEAIGLLPLALGLFQEPVELRGDGLEARGPLDGGLHLGLIVLVRLALGCHGRLVDTEGLVTQFDGAGDERMGEPGHATPDLTVACL
ncbi:hypothetical protein [Candidatus Chloroploca sp. Khr17]|uniref:hypothetical protein n=1 Tax=Candidatus Chloroploca sp. Khr17 TaxID=2496869 RepID=UPI00101CF5A1|nr:hypothetical protein [Candidatus Chloroploca sp. Khr17]